MHFLSWNITPYIIRPLPIPLATACTTLILIYHTPATLAFFFFFTPSLLPILRTSHRQVLLSRMLFPLIFTWFGPSYLYLSLMFLLRAVFLQPLNHQSLESFTISKSFQCFLYSTHHFWKLTYIHVCVCDSFLTSKDIYVYVSLLFFFFNVSPPVRIKVL